KIEGEKAALEKERRMQEAEIKLKRKFGKNAILKGMNLKEGATTIERNRQVGGHRAGGAEDSRLFTQSADDEEK
ncbi:MAG: hypothetical protein IKI41_08455, partial [Clostridia bacterium]|nr:hypothetical protein [Clostridia bacterium]